MNAKSFGTVAWTALLKTLLLVFNLVFFAMGLAFMIIGIYGIRVFKNFFSFAPASTIYVPFISIGVFMMIVGMLSLWCTPKGVTWLLNMYAVVVFILFVAVLAISVLFVVKRDTFEDKLHEGIGNAMKNYPRDAESVDLMQSTLQCCGISNYTEWFNTPWAEKQNNVPISCCKNETSCKHENIDDKDPKDIYQQGCYKKIYMTIESNYALISGVSFASSVVILAGSLISFTLASNLRRNRYEQVE